MDGIESTQEKKGRIQSVGYSIYRKADESGNVVSKTLMVQYNSPDFGVVRQYYAPYGKPYARKLYRDWFKSCYLLEIDPEVDIMEYDLEEVIRTIYILKSKGLWREPTYAWLKRNESGYLSVEQLYY